MQKKPYRVRDGVDRINAARVPADRIVHLTDAEALFDRGLGRIEPMQIKRPRRRRKSANGGN